MNNDIEIINNNKIQYENNKIQEIKYKLKY